MSESVIADDLHIKGEVTTRGDVELKGTIEGEISCRTLAIAEEAKIHGSATAERVIVRGSVDGTIHGIRVTLTSSAHVQGELVCKTLSIDEEAFFEGTSQRVDDPLEGSKYQRDDSNGKAGKNGKSQPKPEMVERLVASPVSQ